MRDDAAQSLRQFNEVVERLRAPGGCPWDREQTHATLAPYLLEETYEVLEAIESGDEATIAEELGDVLLQVFMQSAIAAERDDGFDVGDVAAATMAKMIHRHPHVFGDLAVSGADEVVVNWERLKSSEKAKAGRLSVLDGVPRALPALAHAQGIQKRPARIGFDETPTLTAATARLAGATNVLQELAAIPAPPEPEKEWVVSEGAVANVPTPPGHAPPPAPPSPELTAAVGEVLYAVVAVARKLRVNAEDALRARTNMFAARFRLLEQTARADGIDLHDIDDAEWGLRWKATDGAGAADGAPS